MGWSEVIDKLGEIMSEEGTSWIKITSLTFGFLSDTTNSKSKPEKIAREC